MTTRLDNYALGISSGVPKKMAVINLLLLSFQNSPLYLYIYIYIYMNDLNQSRKFYNNCYIFIKKKKLYKTLCN